MSRSNGWTQKRGYPPRGLKEWQGEANIKRIETILRKGQKQNQDTHRPPNPVLFTTTKELNVREVRWNEDLANFNINLEYRPSLEEEKPDAVARRSGDMTTPKDARKTPRNVVSLLKEKYWGTAIQEYTLETHKIRDILEDQI